MTDITRSYWRRPQLTWEEDVRDRAQEYALAKGIMPTYVMVHRDNVDDLPAGIDICHLTVTTPIAFAALPDTFHIGRGGR